MKKINNIVTKVPIKLIDDYNIDGDFVESQAFAFLAIRSQLSLPISFPKLQDVINRQQVEELSNIKLKLFFLLYIFVFPEITLFLYF